MTDEAFADLYTRFAPPLRVYARGILRSDHDAGDAVQSAMLKALVALRADGVHSGVAPWLYRVVRNESIDMVRRRRDHAGLEALENVAVEDASAPVLRREELRLVCRDVRELAPGQRAALVERAVEHRSHDEIAARLGMTPAAARQAVHAARVRLRSRSVERS